MLKNRTIFRKGNYLLKQLYPYYLRDNQAEITFNAICALFVKSNFDTHDIDVILNSLIVRGFLIENSQKYYLTKEAMIYCEQRSNKLKTYLINNHFSIIAIIISLFALFNEYRN